MQESLVSSTNLITEAIQTVSQGEDLAIDRMTSVFDVIMQGNAAENDIAELLTALANKGESTDEIAGAAMSLRKAMTPIRTDRDGDLLDTCGTGGSGAGVFNISTAAAIVAAAAGVAVAKHGNRAITSKSGSADVLSMLGVNIDAEVPVVEKCINQIGIGFCFAPRLHPAMRHVGPVRKKLGFRTIFNLLGPLCNPAGARYQLLGVGAPELRPILSAALARLNTERAAIVAGDDGLGEVSIATTTSVSWIENGDLSEKTWSPQDFGVEPSPREAILARDPAHSAEIIQAVLRGESGPPRDIVVANAAAALHLAGKGEVSLAEASAKASETIDTGAAANKLAELAKLSSE